MNMKVFNKISGRTWITIGAAAVMVCGLSAGVTAALYTHTTNTAVNGFKSGMVNISVVERTSQNGADLDLEDANELGSGSESDSTATAEEMDNNQGNTIIFQQMNSAGVNKYVAIKNHDKTDYPTVDTYVRVRLVPSVRYNIDSDDSTTHDGEVLPIDMTGAVSYQYATAGDPEKQWLAQDVNGELYYYYPEVLKPGDVTTDLIESVIYSGEIPENAHFELQVLAEGIASEQTGSLSVWFANTGESSADYSNGYTDTLIDTLTPTNQLK